MPLKSTGTRPTNFALRPPRLVVVARAVGVCADQTANACASDTGEQQLITVDRARPIEHFVSQRVSCEASKATNKRTGYDAVPGRVNVVCFAHMVVFPTMGFAIHRHVGWGNASAQTQHAQTGSSDCNLFHD